MATPIIRHLDLGDGRYIENDNVKDIITENEESEYYTWDELWAGVKNDIEKIQKYVQEQQNTLNDTASCFENGYSRIEDIINELEGYTGTKN